MTNQSPKFVRFFGNCPVSLLIATCFHFLHWSASEVFVAISKGFMFLSFNAYFWLAGFSPQKECVWIFQCSIEFGNKLMVQIIWGREKETPVTLLFQTMPLLHLKKRKKNEKCDLHMGW